MVEGGCERQTRPNARSASRRRRSRDRQSAGTRACYNQMETGSASRRSRNEAGQDEEKRVVLRGRHHSKEEVQMVRVGPWPDSKAERLHNAIKEERKRGRRQKMPPPNIIPFGKVTEHKLKKQKMEKEITKELMNCKKKELREHKLNILYHVKFHEQIKPSSSASSEPKPKRTNLVRQHARYFDSWE